MAPKDNGHNGNGTSRIWWALGIVIMVLVTLAGAVADTRVTNAAQDARIEANHEDVRAIVVKLEKMYDILVGQKNGN